MICCLHLWTLKIAQNRLIWKNSLFYNGLGTNTHLMALCLGLPSWYQKGKTNLDFTEARDSE